MKLFILATIKITGHLLELFHQAAVKSVICYSVQKHRCTGLS